MKITVVTVAYNEGNTIEGTINSVLMQTTNSFEYIICDGASSDNTVGIAQKYRKAFEDRGIKYTVISEPDGGTYFGMNNGIEKAEGDYISFLNAGDKYYSDAVLETVINAVESDNKSNAADIIYGNIVTPGEKGGYKLYVANDERLIKDMSIFHPASFIKATLLKQEKYNTAYQIAADYDFFLRQKLKNRRFIHLDCPVAIFDVSGESNTKILKSTREKMQIWESYNIKYFSYYEIIKACMFKIYKWLQMNFNF